MPNPVTLSTDDLLRAKFWALLDEKEAILAKSQPLRDKRDALARQVAVIEAEMESIADEFKAIEGDRLVEIDNERSKIVRALPNQIAAPDGTKHQNSAFVGERPAAA